MPDILHRIVIEAPAERVYEALTESGGLAKWWTKNVKAEAKAGAIAEFSFNEGATVLKMEIEKLEPGSRVEWKCVGGAPEWLDTSLTFELEPAKENATYLKFSQRGYKDESDTLRHCNTKWAYFLISLKAYLEQGEGSPHPLDARI